VEVATTMFGMEDRRVLVIDAAIQKISIVTLKKAWKKIWAGRAEVISYSEDGTVVGTNKDVRIPSVIQLITVVPRWKQRVRFCRQNVLVGRDRCVCQYCGVRVTTEAATMDHVFPRAKGGKTTWENVVCCCMPCNQQKANRTPEEAGMTLKRKPRKPTSLIEVSVKMDLRSIPKEWEPYWTITLDE
jgi:5-methylcytosine-specific restriction endonuclease McrA